MPLTSSSQNEWRSPRGGDTLSFADAQYSPSRKENATHGQAYRAGRTRQAAPWQWWVRAGDDCTRRWWRRTPELGEIRAAQLLPIVVTPYRFKNKRSFWAYCGLGIVMRSSSDWVRTQSGEWVKVPVQQTRGLNRNANRMLKGIFKGAATTVIGQAKDEPLYLHYLRLLDGGTKPNLAKLTLARQVASIMLAVWRNEEVYDPARVGQAV